jgi:hypothetical protein
LLESKIKKTTAKNRLGYGNGDQTWYPTLFGWEKRKRLAYFTTGHELSTACQAVEKGSSASLPSIASLQRTP